MNDPSPAPSAVSFGPPVLSAVDRLRTVYRAPGPYVTVYLTDTGVGPTVTTDDDYWQQLRSDLVEQGAGDDALAAIEARLQLPRSGDIAGIGVIAAADGTTTVATALDPPHHDLAVVDTLPYTAPMLEWDQRSVPHVVVTVDLPDPDGTADRAEQTVRLAADTAARATVHRLRTHKFLRTHDAAVDGTADTVAALAEGTAEWILVHDDPNDQRRLWIGSEPNELSLEQRSGYEQARLVDATIRSAVLQDIGVHIIPSTGAGGPDEDIAAILDTAPE